MDTPIDLWWNTSRTRLSSEQIQCRNLRLQGTIMGSAIETSGISIDIPKVVQNSIFV